MDGTELLDEISRRIMKRRGTRFVPDVELAKEIDVAAPTLSTQWRGQQLTPRKIVNLMGRMEKRAARQTVSQAIDPIVEFFYIDAVESKQGARWELFSVADVGKAGDHPFLAGLKERLNTTHGIYIFHDSRGRAIYAGKALRQTLWTEMNLAFNRKRGDVQSIKRVDHPSNRVAYRTEHGTRSIKDQPVVLHEIASYMSAYAVADELINKLEALIVRAFANDLLNVRMPTLIPTTDPSPSK